MRADLYLAEKLGSRTRAADAIKAGRVSVNGKAISRPAFEIEEGDVVEVQSVEHDYVSRAGGKLLAALDAFSLDFDGKSVLDIGASTGGFTQCALEHGANKVYALDVGHLQLSPTLKEDARVVEMEGVNAKTIRADWFDPLPDAVVMDVSFISAISILEPLFAQFVPEEIVVLVKPQFECTKSALNKKGVIKKKKDELQALEKVSIFLEKYYAKVRSIPSPVVGRNGNQEYLVCGLKRRENLDD